ESFAAVLGPGSRSDCGEPGAFSGGLGVQGPPASGPDDPGHLLERLRRKQRAHLPVSGLPAPNAGNRPELQEQPRAVAVWGEVAPVEPLDPAVAAGDDGEPLDISDDPEAQRLGKSSYLRERAVGGYLFRVTFRGQFDPL